MPPTPGVSPLVPHLLRRQLAAVAGPLRLSTARRSAAVLIADVSGFTALAERLTARGPDGVEELSRLVNRWFGGMSDAIAAHGGDLIRFAGDAPIALFAADASTGALPGAIARAVACAADLRAAMRDLRTTEADVRVRVGIGAGDVTSTIAGGVDDRWEFVVGGSPLAQMADAERRAAPDEIVLSPEAQAISGADGSVAEARALDVEDAPRDDPRLRAFVPSSALQFLDAGHSAWTAELRSVTVLFVNMRGIDLDLANGATRLDAALRVAQQAVFDEGGDLIQFLVDDKGVTLLAAWGVPGHRHEDDAVRAIGASVACGDALRASGIESSAGLATGRVFCGWRGGDRRREYALIGAVVNRAARLMMAAGDGVLMDASTRHGGAAARPIAEAGALVLKGTAAPVQTFRPLETDRPIATAGAASAVMVGRQAERQALARALSALQAGASSSVVIRGDAGMGKSTLVADFTASAPRAGVRVVSGTVASPSGAEPYGPWRSILGAVLSIDDGAVPSARADALRERLASRPDIAEYGPLVAEVLGLPWADSDLTSRLVQQTRVEKTQDLVVELLHGAAAAAPLAIVLDNLQWMDSLSIALARAAARRVTPLLLVIATRPLGADASSEAADLVASAAEVLDLSRLGADDVQRLICQRLGVTHVPADLAEAVEAKAGGYPLFVGELVASLLDAGVIETRGSACVLADHGRQLRTHRLPDSVHGAIADRLDRLPAGAQLTLKVASAAGARFDAAAVAAVHPMQPARADLDRELALLSARGFLLAADPGVFEFRHAIIQDVVYGLMPGDQRRPLHRAVAIWLEQTNAAPAATMAHHWIAAGDQERSLAWLERGGSDAARLGAFRETLRHLADAFAIADGPEAPRVDALRRVRWLRLAGLAHSELGAMDESTGRLRSALALLGQRLPASPAAMMRRLGRESAVQAALLTGVRRAPARLSPAARDRALETAEILRLLGKLAYYAQDHLRYITVSLQSINIAERAGARETAGSAYAALAYIVAMLGLEPLARRWWRLADESGVLDAQLNRQIGQMLFFNSHVRWDESRRAADEQAALIARAGTSTSMPSHLMIRGYIDLHHGRYADAEAEISQLLDWCLSVNHLQQAFAARLQLCAVMIEQGRVDAARQHLGEADALAPHVADPLFLSIYHGTRVRVHMLADEIDAAAAPAAALREVIANSSPYFGEMVGYVAMADYSLARARDASPADARAFTREARWAHAALQRHARLNVYARPRTALMAGRILAAEGRFGRAHASWRRALALGERFRMPREIAYAHADLGSRSRLPASERRAHLHEARTRFTAMGSPHFAAAAERALRSLDPDMVPATANAARGSDG